VRLMKPRTLVLLLLLSLFAVAKAQQTFNVSGTVNSFDDKQPLIGVTITKKGTGHGVVTDLDGKFYIQGMKSGDVLVFTYIGYKKQELTIRDSKPLDVWMHEDKTMLDETIVIGYGTMKRSDYTGAVASVSEEEIKSSHAQTLDQALQGKAAGVQVTENSGAPGGGISVNIRGISSINGNEPLYVIDGVPMTGQGSGNSNALSSINPGDIVNMEVLKDASATAIYGSRASNGVVLITTKHGQVGRIKFSYDGSIGWQQMPKQLKLMNLHDFAVYRNQRSDVLGFGWVSDFADPSLLGDGTNWQDAITRTAPITNHQLTISGGSDYAKYAASFGYLNQDGIALGSSFNRVSARINLDLKVNKWLTVGINSSLSRHKQRNTIDDGGIIWIAFNQWPSVPVINSDGTYGITPEEDGVYERYLNPVGQAQTRENYNRETNFSGNIWGEATFLKYFRFRMEYGGGFTYYNRYYYEPYFDYGNWVQQATSQRQADNRWNYFFRQQLNYGRWMPKLNYDLMIAHEANEDHNESLSGSRQDFLQNSVHELSAGNSLTAKNNSSAGSNSMESYMARANITVLDRYMLTASLRADGSSRFGKNNRWGWFPSFSLGWRISKEKFLEDVPWIENLKLRLGWGLVGNQWIGSYAYGTSMSATATIYGTGFYESNYENPDLKWEETKAWNFGLDLSLFKNRVELIAEYYIKHTDNLLMQASLPDYVTSMISAPYVNAGALQNHGLELTLRTVNISKPAFDWRTAITFTLNRNKVTALYNESSTIVKTMTEGDNTVTTMTVVGQPIGMFYGYKVKGMFLSEADFYQRDGNGDYILDANGNPKQVAIPEGKTINEAGVWVGDYIFEDTNGDGVINASDRQYIGNPEPKFSFGITNTFKYKNFDLNIALTGVVGNDIYNFVKQKWSNPMANSNLLDYAKNYAQIGKYDEAVGSDVLSNVYVANPGTGISRLTSSDANSNFRMSNLFVEDGSYLRIKNVTLGYTLPPKLLRRIGVDELRCYVNIQNLFTFTKYSGYDPEIGSYNYDVTLRGIDWVRYPSHRTYTFGMNIKF